MEARRLRLNRSAGPRRETPFELGEVTGGTVAAREPGCLVLGGHSVDALRAALRHGYIIGGVLHPDRLLTSAGAQPGDVLVLTKPRWAPEC